ncbi:MAG TPA: mechanosensitive ion channel family protein [Patescibacteria group bacterium]|nr:mechanosensitive ion channel family protein [Patescibacteria group bacterium]
MIDFKNYLVPAIIIVFFTALGFIARWVLGFWLHRVARKTPFKYDEVIVGVLRRPVFYWLFFAGLHIALKQRPFPPNVVFYSAPILKGLSLALLTYVIARLVVHFINVRSTKNSEGRGATTLIRKVVQFIVYLLGAIIILDSFEIRIAPILTALGIGGLAVALALQDTLSNVFAGIYLTIANQVRVGDYIQLIDAEGFVKDISWRTTVIRRSDENIVIMPNSKIAQATIVNYHVEDAFIRNKIIINVDFSNDPDNVERLLKEIILESGHNDIAHASSEIQPSGKIRGLLKEPEPLIRFNDFTAAAMNFHITFSVSNFEYYYSVRHELLKKIFLRFREEKIPVSTPPAPAAPAPPPSILPK